MAERETGDHRIMVYRPSDDDEEKDDIDDVLDPESVIKHPLQNSWAMWFFKNDKGRDWKDNLRVITTFDTVEDFWGLYNHTLPASRLQSGCDYSVFKAGIQPMWEDAQNKKGGRWLINLNKSQRQTHLDDFWLETLLCLIGEGFDEHSDDICGATVNIRTKGDKLGLWTRDANKIEATKKIGLKLKESLNVPSKIVIGFQAHSDTAGKAGSTVKNRFTV
ncbi:eukaryotic translation initiation factor 4E [Biomphalaria glabrata]|uniref:Eukaryotic translation initiation factor 4E n=1 Tax=Biomphalaria glabrata TaxID=6526 RepID=A0A2C9K1G4_BIOGL|nr:eukaryotic translation initiation factor 4E [Biomphalaria glabrata]KAI8766695.1 putative eukaryotic translation initiation factor 4E [Biomphalaria glabrata]KAI8794592.1 eukaryotic translation initiation factor 4E [Biomphalaria glabrata]